MTGKLKILIPKKKSGPQHRISTKSVVPKTLELNERQRLFCQHYVQSWNGTQSYLKAYPSSALKTAEVNGSKLLSNTRVQEYIQSIRDDIESVLGLSKMRVVKEVMDLAGGEVKLMSKDEFEKLSPTQRKAIKEVEFTKEEKYGMLPKTKVKITWYSKTEVWRLVSDLMGYGSNQQAPIIIQQNNLFATSDKEFREALG